MPPQIAHSASAHASPPSDTSCAVATAPERTASRTASIAAALTRQVERRQLAREPALQLLELRAGQRRRERADERDRVTLRAEAAPRHALGIRQLADHPHDGRRKDRAPPRPRCRARRCRPRPARATARHASRRPSTARVSCQAMCGFSGFPKLRQFVSPSGSAPTHARFRAHSSTASTAPAYGSHATRRPLPSIDTAIAPDPPSGSSMSTAASASSGRRVVREPTSQSYCSNAQRFEATFGDESRASSVSSADSPPLEPRARGRIDGLGGLGGLEVVDRAVVDQRLDRHVAHHLAARQHAQAARVRDLADGRGADLPLLADGEHLVELVRLDHAQHPLLRLRDHHLEGLHVRLAQRDACRCRCRSRPRPSTPSPTSSR